MSRNETGIANFSISTDETQIFSANTSCMLTPEVTHGPYYVVGELIRQNVKEEQYCDGVDLQLEVQYIDVTTCGPVAGVYVDIWNCNATGVYSGIAVSGNEAADGYNSTYLRGIQETDQDGVVTFDTIFPGHYSGRATHTHLLAHMNVTTYSNNTISADGNVTHIGQLFWPEDLRSNVEAVAPYNTNTQDVVSNDDDMCSIVQAGDEYDPFPEFLYLGDTVEDGLLAWIQIGVNTSANYIDNSYYSVAAYYEADGGHENTEATFTGGGNGIGPGNDTSSTTTATA